MSEILDVVDENDQIVGQAPRDEAHALGLKIRIVYVWFYTSDKKVILQRRSKLKKSYPDRLVSTVSGHVISGMSYEQAAVKETEEETGISISEEQLSFASKVYVKGVSQTGEITPPSVQASSINLRAILMNYA